jgi:asparagine synthase (glutamine-hydrolysing)
VLILRHRDLQRLRVAKLTEPRRHTAFRNPEECYEQFWHVLDQAVGDRLRTHRRVCTSLSGGLDSTTVTIALLKRLPSIDAVSNITERFPEFDEREPIQAFLDRYPQVKWHSSNSDQAWALSEPWETLPIPDDPPNLVTLPMNLQLWEMMQQRGLEVVFTGELGDEICYVGLQDCIRAGCWSEAFKILKAEGRWHSQLWNRLVLPYLPKTLQNRWWRHQTNRLPSALPPWLRSDYAHSEQVQTVRQSLLQIQGLDRQLDILEYPFQNGQGVGLSQMCQMLAAHYGVLLTSPFYDQRVMEFSMTIPPPLQNEPQNGKPLLRQANRSTLPDMVRLRPKDNYFDPVKYAGLGEGKQGGDILEQFKKCVLLHDRIDPVCLEQSFHYYQSAYHQKNGAWQVVENTLANQLFTVLTFARWHGMVERIV